MDRTLGKLKTRTRRYGATSLTRRRPISTLEKFMKPYRITLNILIASFALQNIAQSQEIGQTESELISIIGKPNSIVSAGSKSIYLYDTKKITLVDGKVDSIKEVKRSASSSAKNKNDVRKASSYDEKLEKYRGLLDKPVESIFSSIGSPLHKHAYGNGINHVYTYENLRISALNGHVWKISYLEKDSPHKLPKSKATIKSTKILLKDNQREVTYKDIEGHWARKDWLRDEHLMFTEYKRNGMRRSGVWTKSQGKGSKL